MTPSEKRNKRRHWKYRLSTSIIMGVALVLLLAWYGHKRHDTMPAGGAVFGALLFGLVMFVIWTIGSVYRRIGERARERERQASQPRRRRGGGRRYARQG